MFNDQDHSCWLGKFFAISAFQALFLVRKIFILENMVYFVESTLTANPVFSHIRNLGQAVFLMKSIDKKSESNERLAK